MAKQITTDKLRELRGDREILRGELTTAIKLEFDAQVTYLRREIFWHNTFINFLDDQEKAQ